MTKILFISGDNIPHIGGKSTHILDLMNGMKNEDVSVMLVSATEVNKKEYYIYLSFIRIFKYIDVHIYEYYKKKILGYLILKKVKKILKNNTIDYISYQDAWIASIVGKKIKNKNLKSILTMHTYLGLENSIDKSETFFSEKINYKTYLEEVDSLRQVDSVIAVDSRIKNHILEKLKEYDIKPSVTSIKNFTDINVFSPINDIEKNNLKSTLNIPMDKFVISCSRRLVKKNGVINAVKSMKFLENDNIILLIAGEGNEKNEILKIVKEEKISEKVFFKGSLNKEEILNLYHVSDVSLVPSVTVNGLQEATSISAIESMACGIPTVASSIGGLREVIEHNVSGVLVNENDPMDIAIAINNLIRNKEFKKSIGIKSRETIKKDFSIESATKNYLNEFYKIKKEI